MKNLNNKEIKNNFISKIKKVIKHKEGFLHEPYLKGAEKKYLVKCIASNYVSSSGEFIDKFKTEIQKFTKCKYIVLTNSGTSALHIASVVSGIKCNEEVLIPSFNYIASANVACYSGAIPHFIDIEEASLGIDAYKLEKYLKKICSFKNGFLFNKKTQRKISSIITTHLYGNIGNMEKLLEVSKKYNLKLIEDAAEALGSFYKNKHAGTFGNAGIISFNGNKTITTGSGGAILFKNIRDQRIAEKLINISKINKGNYITFDGIGYNYRISNLQAALGLAQIEKLKIILKKKEKLHFNYQKIFKDCTYGRLFKNEKNNLSNYWINLFILNNNLIRKKTLFEKTMKKHKLEIRTPWELMHRLPHFRNNPSMKNDISKKMIKKIIYLPSSAKYA